MKTIDQLPNSKDYSKQNKQSLEKIYDNVKYIGKDSINQDVYEVSFNNQKPMLRAFLTFKDYKKIVMKWVKNYPTASVGISRISTPYYKE